MLAPYLPRGAGQSHMGRWIGFLIPPPEGEGGPPSVARRVGWGPPPRLASLADPPPLRGGGISRAYAIALPFGGGMELASRFSQSKSLCVEVPALRPSWRNCRENEITHFRADGSPCRPVQQVADLPTPEFRGLRHSAGGGGKGGGAARLPGDGARGLSGS